MNSDNTKTENVDQRSIGKCISCEGKLEENSKILKCLHIICKDCTKRESTDLGVCCKCKIVTIGELIDYPTEASNKPQVKIYYALLFCFKNIYRNENYKKLDLEKKEIIDKIDETINKLHKEIDKTSLEIKKELETNITNDVSIVNKNVEVLIVLRKEYEHYHGLINSVINNSGAINLINLSKIIDKMINVRSRIQDITSEIENFVFYSSQHHHSHGATVVAVAAVQSPQPLCCHSRLCRDKLLRQLQRVVGQSLEHNTTKCDAFMDRSSNSNSSSESSDLDENYVPSRPIDITLLGSSRPVTRSLNNRQKENVIQDCRQSNIKNKNYNSKLLLGTKDNIQTIESNNTQERIYTRANKGCSPGRQILKGGKF
ncbi:hypothetical protein QTP88_027276 [Uroleucon formosanum]